MEHQTFLHPNFLLVEGPAAKIPSFRGGHPPVRATELAACIEELKESGVEEFSWPELWKAMVASGATGPETTYYTVFIEAVRFDRPIGSAAIARIKRDRYRFYDLGDREVREAPRSCVRAVLDAFAALHEVGHKDVHWTQVWDLMQDQNAPYSREVVRVTIMGHLTGDPSGDSRYGWRALDRTGRGTYRLRPDAESNRSARRELR